MNTSTPFSQRTRQSKTISSPSSMVGLSPSAFLQQLMKHTSSSFCRSSTHLLSFVHSSLTDRIISCPSTRYSSCPSLACSATVLQRQHERNHLPFKFCTHGILRSVTRSSLHPFSTTHDNTRARGDREATRLRENDLQILF
jgi:hypothetical protein